MNILSTSNVSESWQKDKRSINMNEYARIKSGVLVHKVDKHTCTLTCCDKNYLTCQRILLYIPFYLRKGTIEVLSH